MKNTSQDTDLRELAQMFKALSNKNRLRLFLEILREHQQDFQDHTSCFLNPIMGRLKIGAPTVSHHLKELVNAQLVSTERQGKFLTCSINPAAMQRLEAFFAARSEDAG